jgi:hypothetical protein
MIYAYSYDVEADCREALKIPNSTLERTQTLAGQTNWWLLLVVFGLMVLVGVVVASRERPFGMTRFSQRDC